MSIHSARSIDVHAHAVLEETMGAAGPFGPELGGTSDSPWFRVGEYRLDGVRYRGSAFMDTDVRLEQMDASGIEFQILSPNPLTYFHFIDEPEAIAFCRRHNDALAARVSAHPDRLAGIAALPMQCVDAAIDELQRATDELGLLGAGIGAELPVMLDDPTLDALYAALCERDVPLFIHPAPAGIDGPTGDARLKRFDLEILLGFAAQETLAIATLILGGVLSRHPDLDVCVSHGGGAIAILAERLADATRRRPWSPQELRQDGAFESQLQRVWVDNHVHDHDALPRLASLVGSEHIVLGTNFAGWDQPRRINPEATDTQRMADNARRLLRVAPRLSTQ